MYASMYCEKDKKNSFFRFIVCVVEKKLQHAQQLLWSHPEKIFVLGDENILHVCQKSLTFVISWKKSHDCWKNATFVVKSDLWQKSPPCVLEKFSLDIGIFQPEKSVLRFRIQES